MGYVKRKSLISLLAGWLTAALVFLTVLFSWNSDNPSTGFFTLAVISLTLMVMFFNRYLASGQQLMPSGFMTLLSGLSFALFFVAMIFA